MSTLDAAEVSDEVMRLVRTVARLNDDDQERILKIVRLLTRAPAAVRDQTHDMLRTLLEAEPSSMRECISAVEEVIEYLEYHIPRYEDLPDNWSLLDYPVVSTRRN